jgi:hypothetical protein
LHGTDSASTVQAPTTQTRADEIADGPPSSLLMVADSRPFASAEISEGFVEKGAVVMISDDREEILVRTLAIVEELFTNAGTLQQFVLVLAERVDALERAAVDHSAQVAELRSEVAALKRSVKKAKKK